MNKTGFLNKNRQDKKNNMDKNTRVPLKLMMARTTSLSLKDEKIV